MSQRKTHLEENLVGFQMWSFICLPAMESGNMTIPALKCDNMHGILMIREAYRSLVSRVLGKLHVGMIDCPLG